MSDDDLLLEEDTDLTSLVRLVTGEYVVGVIDEELSEESVIREHYPPNS